ncbi:MAG TPA: flagellin [Bacteroidota bacterium]|nr:flagellin [Bacteroidota bacterium]
MAVSIGARINTPINAYNAYNALNNINRQLGTAQLRLATGLRINTVADDPSGYTIAKQMEATAGVLSQAVNNISDANNMLDTAEQALQTVRDLFTTIQQKVAAANDPVSDKTALSNDVNQLTTEINDVITKTSFNGTSLFNVANFSQKFQVGATLSDSVDVTYSASFASIASQSSATIASLDVSAQVNTVVSALQTMGSLIARMNTKQQNLNVAITNTQASESSIMDADIAKEQLNASKLQILQQTAVTQLAQANVGNQVFLKLFQ